jgi:hypothetical protein
MLRDLILRAQASRIDRMFLARIAHKSLETRKRLFKRISSPQ